MNQFPTAAPAASWAGLCPGNCESAGKRQSGRTLKGARYLRCMLIQNAWAVSHSKDRFLTALFYRIASRRGGKRAAMVVAHRVLLIAYYIIWDGKVYQELGGDHYDRKNPERTARRLTQRLERIGYQVTLTVAVGRANAPSADSFAHTKWDLINPSEERFAHNGENTDNKDCRRLAELVHRNLLHGSFLPPVVIRELRQSSYIR